MSDILRRRLDSRKAHARVEEELRRLEQQPEGHIARGAGQVVRLVQRRQKSWTGQTGREAEVEHCVISHAQLI